MAVEAVAVGVLLVQQWRRKHLALLAQTGLQAEDPFVEDRLFGCFPLFDTHTHTSSVQLSFDHLAANRLSIMRV